MNKQSMLETVLGGIVLIVAALFLSFAYKTADVAPSDGYTLYAEFLDASGLTPGSDILLGGVKVGSVSDVDLNKQTYRARIAMTIANDIEIPTDTVALIASNGLLGGSHLKLEIGGSFDMLEPGDDFEFSQTSPSLEQLLGQAIYSLTSSSGEESLSSASEKESEDNATN